MNYSHTMCSYPGPIYHPKNEILCKYSYERYPDGRLVYVCKIDQKVISLTPTLTIKGQHEPCRSNSDVNEVRFVKCIMQNVPQGLTKTFPNMVDLSIWWSNLDKVTRNDMIEYKNLERFGFCENQTEYLPGDLFEGFENLEEIIFNGNKLKIIEPNILDGLEKLKIVNFTGNPNYSKCFSVYPEYNPNATLEEVKSELFEKFYSEVPHNVKIYLKNLQNKKQDSTIGKIHDGVCGDLKKFLQADEHLKDLKIIVENREFNVHKTLFAARCPTVTEILSIKPFSVVIILDDIPVDIFQKILKFIYTDELPVEFGTSYKQLFAASSQLKIEKLIKFAADKILNQIYPDNAIEIFNLGVKYEHIEMQQKAYCEAKKKYAFLEFKDSWGKVLTW